MMMMDCAGGLPIDPGAAGVTIGYGRHGGVGPNCMGLNVAYVDGHVEFVPNSQTAPWGSQNQYWSQMDRFWFPENP
jgi:prepilin-type processing-associated H-X9-DG protein